MDGKQYNWTDRLIIFFTGSFLDIDNRIMNHISINNSSILLFPSLQLQTMFYTIPCICLQFIYTMYKTCAEPVKFAEAAGFRRVPGTWAAEEQEIHSESVRFGECPAI